MYAEVDMESENAVEDDNAVYVHLRNVYGICVFLACARVCAGECMAYELADARAWVRANAPACQVSICKTKAPWWLPVLENARTHARGALCPRKDGVFPPATAY